MQNTKITSHYKMVYLKLVGKASQQVEESFEAAKSFTLKVLTAFLTLSILAFLAVFMYGMFYFTFVPSPEHEGQIFLEFEPCEETPGWPEGLVDIPFL